MNPFVISQKINGDFKTQGGQGLDTHNKEAILRRGKRGKRILSSEIQNGPLTMPLERSAHCLVPHWAAQHSGAAQLPAETSQALAHSSRCWESRCSFEITAF